MAHTPLISVCIPTYNGEAYLRPCLDSCLQQGFDDYELVICDDGSSDTTVQIIEAYAKEHPRIRFFKNAQNLGLVGNWNNCIEKAQGSWIKFLFQDDLMTPDCLAQLMARADGKTQLLVSARDFLLPENASPEQVSYYTQQVRTLTNTTAFRGSHYSAQLISRIAADNLCLNFIGEPSLICFKKQLVQELGYFTADLKQICDLEFALRVAGKYGLTYMPEKLCTFRVHAGSTTSSNIQQRFFELRYLEPVIFAWYLCFSLQHSAFRQHITALQKWKLWLYFNVKARQAWQAAANEQQLQLMEQASGRFPEIAKARRGSLLTRLVARLKK